MTDQMTRLLAAARPAQFRPGTPVEPATRERELATALTAARPVADPSSHARGRPAVSALRPGRGRRGAAWLAASGLAVAASLALSLSAAGAHHSPPGTRAAGAQPGSARLAEWTVHTNADGTVTMTLRQLTDAAGLQRVLAAHGVHAIVHAGVTMCQEADGQGPPGLDRVISHPRSGGDPWDTTAIVIRPAAIPRGSELLLDILLNSDGQSGVGAGLIYGGRPIKCQLPPPPDTAPSPVLTPPAKS